MRRTATICSTAVEMSGLIALQWHLTLSHLPQTCQGRVTSACMVSFTLATSIVLTAACLSLAGH